MAETKYCCQIKNKQSKGEYTTIQAAIDECAAHKEYDTIILTSNVTENIAVPEKTSIIIDLNDFVFSGGKTKETPAILNRGNLTITDNGLLGIGQVIREDVDKPSYYVIDNQNELTILGGRFFNNSGKLGSTYGSSLIRNGGDAKKAKAKQGYAKLTIHGGQFHQDHFIVIKNDDGGDIVMDGGIIESEEESCIINFGNCAISGGCISGLFWTRAWSDDFTVSTTLSDNTSIQGRMRVDLESDSLKSKPSLDIRGGEYDAELQMYDITNVNIESGLFTDSRVLSIIDDSIPAAKIDRDKQKLEYAISGDTITTAVNTCKMKDSVEVLQGSVSLSGVSNGVKVMNSPGNTDIIHVNDEPMNPGQSELVLEPLIEDKTTLHSAEKCASVSETAQIVQTLHIIASEINSAANRGETYIAYRRPICQEVKDELLSLGYSIKVSKYLNPVGSDSYIISWEK